MKLGKLGLYFILSAAAVLSVFAVDHGLGAYKAEIDATDNTKVKISLGATDLTFTATAESATAIQKAAAARTVLPPTTLTGTVGDASDSVVFPDGRKLTFAVATNKLTITPEENQKPFSAITEPKSLEEAKIILTATQVKFGDIEVAGLTADKVKELGLHEGTTAAGDDAWLRGTSGTLTFHVARKGDKVYIVTASSAVGSTFWGHAKQALLFTVILGIVIIGMNFVVRAVDEDAFTAGVSGSSIMPQTFKNVLVGEEAVEDMDDIDVITTEGGEQVVVRKDGKFRPTGSDKAQIEAHEETIGTAEVTLAAMFLLPFLL